MMVRVWIYLGEKFKLTCHEDKFRKFGPGVFLMFKFIKWMIIITLVACVFSLVQFFVLLESPYYQDSGNIVRLNLMRLTIASLQPAEEAGCKDATLTKSDSDLNTVSSCSPRE